MSEPILSVRDLSTSFFTQRGEVQAVRGVSFDVHPGEILGIAGLQGMGQQDLFLACFGMAELNAGTVLVDGKPVRLGSPADAIRPVHGTIDS